MNSLPYRFNSIKNGSQDQTVGKGTTWSKRPIFYIFLTIFLISSLLLLYIFFNVFMLARPNEYTEDQIESLVNVYIEEKSSSVDKKIEDRIFKEGKDRLIIPKLGLDVGILQGDSTVLEDGLWHRFPDRGDPVNGGNFILSGHRFNIGFSSAGIRRSSPLYTIDKLTKGDTLLVIWGEKLYKYEIYEVVNVKPNQTEIENIQEDPRLTLYTCTLEGSSDGRVVIYAELGE